MSSPIDRLNELPPLPRRAPTPRRTWRYVLVLITVLLLANAFVGERGLIALFRANLEHAQLRQDIDTLHAENDQLHRYVEALTEEPRIIEDVARRELGLIRPGEQLFIVRTTTAPPTAPAALPPVTDSAADSR
jgi:cell division protein FtsB